MSLAYYNIQLFNRFPCGRLSYIFTFRHQFMLSLNVAACGVVEPVACKYLIAFLFQKSPEIFPAYD